MYGRRETTLSGLCEKVIFFPIESVIFTVSDPKEKVGIRNIKQKEMIMFLHISCPDFIDYFTSFKN
jgi:hypothetical protein